MIESRYIIPGAPRMALLSDLHNRPYQEILLFGGPQLYPLFAKAFTLYMG